MPLTFRVRGIILFNIFIGKTIAAFWTEFWWILGIYWFPATLVTDVQRLCCGFLCAAFRAELAFVDTAATAYPALRATALGAEITGIDSPTFTGPFTI